MRPEIGEYVAPNGEFYAINGNNEKVVLRANGAYKVNFVGERYVNIQVGKSSVDVDMLSFEKNCWGHTNI